MRTNDVAAHEEAFFARHLVELVGVDQALAVVEAIEALEVAGLADGGDDQVSFQIHFGARHLNRFATRVVEFHYAQRRGAAPVIENDLDRRECALNDDTFTLGVVDFVFGGVHFVD